MSVIGSNALAGASGQGGGDFLIEKSLRFNTGDSAYLNRTPSSAGNRKTWTWSGWIKRSELGGANVFFSAAPTGTTNNGFVSLGFLADDTLLLKIRDTTSKNYGSNAKFRDPSAWYHVVAAVDTANATASERQKLYVNGVEITDLQYNNAISQDTQTSVNNTEEQRIGATVGATGGVNPDFNGYLADVYLIDGQALDPTLFGAFDDNGVWQAAEYTGSYGTNGFHLDFADGSNIGNDAAGSNNWTANNLTTTGTSSALDLLFDSPANGDPANDTEAGGVLSGNYCTWNPLTLWNGGGTMQLVDGNLNFGDQGTASRYGSIAGSIAVNSGKWFVECTLGSGTGLDSTVYFGLLPVESLATLNAASYFNTPGCIAVKGNAQAYKQGSGTTASYASNIAVGDTLSIAFNCDDGSSTWYLNGTSLGSFPYSFDSSKSWTPFASDWSNNQPCSEFILNCGQRPFSMTPPTGYKAICTANLPTPTIADGSTAFDIVTYTSDGTSRTISGLNMSPDLVWSKRRSASARHVMSDSVRGVNKELFPNLTNVERTSTDGLTSFNSDGYTLGDDAGQYGWQSNTQTFVNWAWDAGSSTVSNTDGSITSSVRANQTAGFSIVSYTGNGGNTAATVGHGLNATPEFIIIKSRDSTTGWEVFHGTQPGKLLYLYTTDTAQTSSAFGTPNSSTITVADTWINATGDDYIAYCFAPVEGYSAFGSYTGNANANGPFVYTGFRPKFLLIKGQDIAVSWLIYDAERNTYNLVDRELYADRSDSENGQGVSDGIDFCSTGFKVRSADSWLNSNNNNYIYAAFAENPFQANGGLAR